MSSRLERRDWMFSAVSPPWHGIGTVTPDVLKAQEAIKTAKLDWGVGKRAVYRFDPFPSDNLTASQRTMVEQLQKGGVPLALGNLRALGAYALTVREDLPFTDPASDLGVVGVDYAAIQNAAAFDLCDRVVGGIGAKYETAGSLMNGKRVFLLARFPQTVKVKDDELTPYLLATTAHDGSEALVIKFTLVRVVCWNTLSLAMAEASFATVRVKHSAGNLDAQGNVRQAVADDVRTGINAQVGDQATGDKATDADFVSAATAYLRTQSRIFTQLADFKVSDAFVRDYLAVVFPVPVKGNETRSLNKRQQVADIYYGTQPGNDQQAMQGNAYRLYNAVTFFSDHLVSPRRTTDKGTGEQKTFAEARFNRITSGVLRDDALNILTEAVDSDGKTLRDALDKHREEREQAAARALAVN